MQTIETRFIPATNTKGERVKAIASGGGGSVTLQWSYSGQTVDCHFEAVKALCLKLGWLGKFVAGSTKKGFVWVFVESHGHTEEQFEV